MCPATTFETGRVADKLRAERPRHPDRPSEVICIPALWIMTGRGVPQLRNPGIEGWRVMSKSLFGTGSMAVAVTSNTKPRRGQ